MYIREYLKFMSYMSQKMMNKMHLLHTVYTGVLVCTTVFIDVSLLFNMFLQAFVGISLYHITLTAFGTLDVHQALSTQLSLTLSPSSNVPASTTNTR